MTALADFVTRSATSYLQSVVFVDDHIYHKDDKPLETAISVACLKPMFVDLDRAVGQHGAEILSTVVTGERSNVSKEQVAAQEDEGSPYHPRQLMESFAQKGIVCALYEPRKGFQTTPSSELFRLCERADVIILDWDLHTDGGDGVSDLLAELIKKSEGELPHHVRFCAIYTSEQRLHNIMGLLLEKLEGRGCSVEVVQGRLHLIAGATRVSIFGKPASISRSPDDAEYEVPEEELAERVIGDFAKLHHGVLPAFALHGLASVRRNTKRLLDKFRGELDGSFLLHRALILNTSEAFDELPELLSDEIRAVLEDSWPGQVPISAVASSAIDALSLADPTPRWSNTNGVTYDAQSKFRQMLREGHKVLYEARNECNQLKELKFGSLQGIKAELLKSLESMLFDGRKSWPELLAALFCNRTQYGTDGRKLHFGTVVRHKMEVESQWSYSLCLMPICDSQRLRTAQTFPFWKLKSDTKCGVVQKRYGIAIEVADGTTSLAAGGKLRDMLWMASFTPHSGGWVTSNNNEGIFQFETPGLQVQWVAELKPLHAQRIAAHMGTEVSRVGLVESEWLRLFCDR